MQERYRTTLMEEISDPYLGREAKLYEIHGEYPGFEVVIMDGRWKTFLDYIDASNSMMNYIKTGRAPGYESGRGRQKSMWKNPSENPGLGNVLIVGGIVAAVGAWLWSRSKKTAAPAAPAAPAPGTVPPAASPTDLAPSSDNGIIDVQGLGYFTTNRRNRIRRLPNR